MNAAQRTAVGKNIFNGLSSKFFSRSANVNRVSSQFRNADCALQQGGVAEFEKGLVGAHARAFSTGEYKCSHHGERVTNYKAAIRLPNAHRSIQFDVLGRAANHQLHGLCFNLELKLLLIPEGERLSLQWNLYGPGLVRLQGHALKS